MNKKIITSLKFLSLGTKVERGLKMRMKTMGSIFKTIFIIITSTSATTTTTPRSIKLISLILTITALRILLIISRLPRIQIQCLALPLQLRVTHNMLNNINFTKCLIIIFNNSKIQMIKTIKANINQKYSLLRHSRIFKWI